MQLEPNHPFEVLIFNGLSPGGQKTFSINSGKIINFYNPLNYRYVQCDSEGPFLPSLPYPIKRTTGNQNQPSVLGTSFIINDDVFKIDIFLFCSFKPPENWVAGPSYIPMIDKAWIVYRTFSDLENLNKYTVNGSVLNPSENNIKLLAYDISLDPAEDNLGLFENEINWIGNAINLGPIALLQKNQGVWSIIQFLKDNYIFSDFFDSKFFEACNTEKFNLNVKKEIDGKDKLFNDDLLFNKEKVINYLNYPNKEETKGYIKYAEDIYLYKSASSSMFKFPLESARRLEKIPDEYDPFKFNF